ncbi:hypothetical protein SDC9_184896 [bioreactor metagenome]|uniref:SAM-dependent MTase RsmB/NOP-type domain-containing protein n=1 Tax=bioreactor metagenome TaxID=1076179 RepID=A0A645HGR7_9ZZZZ
MLLLDEPTSGLDPESVIRVEALLQAQQRDSGLAIVLVTHAQAQADRMAARQYQLQSGQLVLRPCTSDENENKERAA